MERRGGGGGRKRARRKEAEEVELLANIFGSLRSLSGQSYIGSTRCQGDGRQAAVCRVVWRGRH